MDEEEEVDYDFDSPDKPPPPPEDAISAEEIYGDLYDEHGEGQTLLKPKLAALEEKCKGLEARVEDLKKQLAEANLEKEKLEEDKRILTRNISCLYRTAKEELSRQHNITSMKNEEILRLQLRLNAPNAPPFRPPLSASPGQYNAAGPISPDFGKHQKPPLPHRGEKENVSARKRLDL